MRKIIYWDDRHHKLTVYADDLRSLITTAKALAKQGYFVQVWNGSQVAVEYNRELA